MRTGRVGQVQAKLCRASWSFRIVATCLAAAAVSGCTDPGDVSAQGGSGGTSKVGSGGGGAASSGGGMKSSGGVTSSGGSTSSSGGSSSGGVTGTSGSTASGGGSTSGGDSSGGKGGSTDSGGSSSGGGGGGAPSACPKATPLTGGTQYCSNKTGNVGTRYSYELWAEGGGTGCMNVYGVDAAFSANWANVEDFLARIGLSFDQTKTPDQIGKLAADFAETKTGGDGLVYIGIYGWTIEPLREYYILDDWGDVKPAGVASDGTPRTKVGTFDADGGTYDVWMKTRTNKPAITGPSETFDQYFSIRQTARQCGHISISDHFTYWKSKGLELGKLYEAKILVEAQDSTGTVDFTKATVTVQ